MARLNIIKRVIAESMPPGTGKKIVDIGCGTGATVAALSEHYKSSGFDPSEAAIGYARTRFPDCAFKQSDIATIPREAVGDADLVLMLDVIEHIADDRAFVRSIVEVMKPGAKMLVSVPADADLWGPQDEAVGHYRRYDPAMLRSLLQGLPVTVLLLTHFNARLYPVVYLARWLARRIGRSLGEGGTDFHMLPGPLNRLLTTVFEGEGRTISALAAGRSRRSYSRGVSIIIVNDGSRDATLPKLIGHLDSHPELRVIDLYRNFGVMAAIAAGIKSARGKSIVVIDGDLQDPPELIGALYEKWKDGADVVYGLRTKRGEQWYIRALTSCFYSIHRRSPISRYRRNLETLG